MGDTWDYIESFEPAGSDSPEGVTSCSGNTKLRSPCSKATFTDYPITYAEEDKLVDYLTIVRNRPWAEELPHSLIYEIASLCLWVDRATVDRVGVYQYTCKECGDGLDNG